MMNNIDVVHVTGLATTLVTPDIIGDKVEQTAMKEIAGSTLHVFTGHGAWIGWCAMLRDELGEDVN